MLGRTMLNSEIHLSKATQERDRIYRSDQEEGHIRERCCCERAGLSNTQLVLRTVIVIVYM